MPTYFLDTNIVSYLVEGNVSLRNRLAATEGRVVISTLILEEIFVMGYGAEINNIRSGRSKASEERTCEQFAVAFAYLSPFQIEPYTADADALFKTYRKAKHRSMDGRIGAHAVTLGAVVVTANVGDFVGILDLVVEDWTQ